MIVCIREVHTFYCGDSLHLSTCTGHPYRIVPGCEERTLVLQNTLLLLELKKMYMKESKEGTQG